MAGDNTVRQTGAAILAKVAKHKFYADHLLNEAFERYKLNTLDRNLLTELVNGTLRWRGRLDWILEQLYYGDFQKSPFLLKSILELSLYQLIYLDRIPEYAAVSEAVRLAKNTGGEKWGRLVNAVLRAYIRNKNSFNASVENSGTIKDFAVAYSHPEWIIERWLALYGKKKTRLYCQYNNERPQVAFRIVGSGEQKQYILSQLKSANYQFTLSHLFNNFLRIENADGVFDSNVFRSGQLTCQDESTAIASLLLRPEPGEKVLDMCAAPGGKTCHLAEIMQDKGHLLAVDSDKKRLARLESNVRRLKLKSIRIIQADSTKLDGEKFDKILIDAPCSGLGVLARRADLRWQREPADIRNIAVLQAKLLDRASKLLHKGGAMVYSTCTLEPEETKLVIDAFLKSNPDMDIDSSPRPDLTVFRDKDGSYCSLPFEHNIDGCFAVRLLKKN